MLVAHVGVAQYFLNEFVEKEVKTFPQSGKIVGALGGGVCCVWVMVAVW